MTNEDIIQRLAELRKAIEHEKNNHSTEERKDKLTAVIGHLQYAIQRMHSTIE